MVFMDATGIGQLHHGLSGFRQFIPKLALQISFNSPRFNGLGFDHGTHALVGVHCRQRSSQKFHPEFLPSFPFTRLLEFLRGWLETFQMLAVALRRQSCQRFVVLAVSIWGTARPNATESQ
jgi:hypothetical protein